MSETEVQEPLAVVEETAVPTESVPEAPEAVSTGAEPESTDTPSARPRDASGRFMKRDGTPVAPDEQAALEKAAAADIPATPTTSPASTPQVTSEPFVFRAEGQKIPITGATLDSDGTLKVPPDQVPMIRQLLAEGVAHRGSWRQKEQDFQRRIEEAGAVDRARAESFNRVGVILLNRVNDPEWLAAAAQDPREVQHLVRELGLELKEAKLQAPRVQEAPKAEAPNNEQLEAAFTAALTDEVDELLEDPRIRGLFTTEETKELKDDFNARMAAYAADVDGQIMLDRHAVKRAFDREVKIQQKIKQAAAEAANAQKFNEKRAQPAAPVAPVVSTKGPGSSGSTTKKYESRDEWRKSMGMN